MDATLLPSPLEQAWLLAAVADLVRRRGPEPLVGAPVVLADPRFFPDQWSPDAAGVERVLLRLLRYAGLPDARVHVEVEDSGTGMREIAGWGGQHSDRHEGAAGWFMGIDRGVYLFGVDPSLIGPPDTLVAVLAHETAHAWRARWRLEVDDRAHEERLTDLTTVYLGFGVLTANAAWRFRSGQQGLRFAWQRQETGYLGFRSLSYLLALVAHARGLGWWQRQRLAWRLAPNQRAAFRRSWARIDRTRDEVLDELGVLAPRVADLGRRTGTPG